MSVISSPALFMGEDGYQISRSVRLRSSASAYLSRTFGSATNTTTKTISLWLKRGVLSVEQYLWSGGSSGSNEDWCRINADNTITLQFAGGTNGTLTSTPVWRDPSGWYHMVFAIDTTQGTAANRVKLWVNNQAITFSGTQNGSSLTGWMINTQPGNLMRRTSTGASYMDGYLTEVYGIDGQALTPSSFGENDSITGVWKPKKYTGTYGTNGFYLNFSDNSNNTAATIGKDYSGNGNNWTPNNISVTTGSTYDSMLDTPTPYADGGNGRGNYAVLNPLNKPTNTTITNGNLLASNAVGAIENVRSTMPTASTLSYWECTATTVGSGLRMEFGGILSSYVQAVSNTSYLASTSPASPTGTFGAVWNSGLTFVVNGSSVYTNGSANIAANDVIQFAHDSSTGKIWLGLNGTWYNSGNPAAGTGNVATLTADTVFPAMMLNGSAGTNAAYINFGQRPFAYTPPSGFKALNTQNLPEGSIKAGNKYFDATTYTGTGASNNTITNAGMQPDLLWIKSRSLGAGGNHMLVDSVRGVGTGTSTKEIYPNLTNAESPTSSVTSFNTTGFTLTGGTGVERYNASGNTYVGWQWKAGNSAGSSNTSGSITTTVSVNATAGFSVLTGTGTSTTGVSTWGHGLGTTPAMVIVKNRDLADDWFVWHQSLSSASSGAYYLKLNLTNAVNSGTVWGGSSYGMTSTTIGINNPSFFSATNQKLVMYCWAEVAGFSKFGSYTGNLSTDGPFVYCGFRPKFILTKRTDSTSNWTIQDTSRDTYNVTNDVLMPNLSVATQTGPWFDILSNGFKIRNNGSDTNASGGTYIYAAFAENPFKNSLAR